MLRKNMRLFHFYTSKKTKKNSHVEVVEVESGHKSGDDTDVVAVLESYAHTDMHLVDAVVEDTIETAADCILD